MSNKHHIALLPGLDGTGELFFPIIPFLEKDFEVHVIKYDYLQSFDDHVQCVIDQLPENTPISLVAESFSGPIALALLANKQRNFQASVLSATFCKSPLPQFVSHMWRYIPEFFFAMNPAYQLSLDWLAIGNDIDPDVRSRTHKILETIPPRYIQNRMCLVNEIDVSQLLKEIEVPLLYIQASRDHIVSRNSGLEIKQHINDMNIVSVDGPHMILQSEPKLCADLIIEHITTYLSTEDSVLCA